MPKLQSSDRSEFEVLLETPNLFWEILQHLTVRELLVFSQACKQLHRRIVRSSSIWSGLLSRDLQIAEALARRRRRIYGGWPAAYRTARVAALHSTKLLNKSTEPLRLHKFATPAGVKELVRLAREIGVFNTSDVPQGPAQVPVLSRTVKLSSLRELAAIAVARKLKTKDAAVKEFIRLTTRCGCRGFGAISRMWSLLDDYLQDSPNSTIDQLAYNSIIMLMRTPSQTHFARGTFEFCFDIAPTFPFAAPILKRGCPIFHPQSPADTAPTDFPPFRVAWSPQVTLKSMMNDYWQDVRNAAPASPSEKEGAMMVQDLD